MGFEVIVESKKIIRFENHVGVEPHDVVVSKGVLEGNLVGGTGELAVEAGVPDGVDIASVGAANNRNDVFGGKSPEEVGPALEEVVGEAVAGETKDDGFHINNQ